MRTTAVKFTQHVPTKLATKFAAMDAVSVTVVNSVYKYTLCLLADLFLWYPGSCVVLDCIVS